MFRFCTCSFSRTRQELDLIAPLQVDSIYTPVQIAGITLENRFVRSATATGTCEVPSGIPTEKFYDLYQSLARGHPGLIIMEHAFVSARGHAGHRQLGIQSDEMTKYHKRVV